MACKGCGTKSSAKTSSKSTSRTAAPRPIKQADGTKSTVTLNGKIYKVR